MNRNKGQEVKKDGQKIGNGREKAGNGEEWDNEKSIDVQTFFTFFIRHLLRFLHF